MKTLKDIYIGKIHADDEVLKNAPRNKKQGELEFFSLGEYVSDDDLEKEYKSRGLMPADLYALAAWNEEHKDDGRKYFATHWKDKDGNWCFAAFGRWGGDGRGVFVLRSDGDEWSGRWWFGGVRKDSSSRLEPKPSSDTLPLELRIEKLETWAKETGYKP